MTHLRFLARYFAPQKRRVAAMSAVLLAGSVARLGNPLIVRYFIDSAVAGGAATTLLLAASGFVALTLFAGVLSMTLAYVGGEVGWRATNLLRSDLASHCLSLDASFHARHLPGDLIERIDGDVTTLANFFTQFSIRLLGNGLLLVGVLAVLLAINAWISLFLLVFAVATLVTLARLQRRGTALWARERQASGDCFGFLEERLSGLEDIQPNRGGPHVVYLLHGWLRGLAEAYRSARLASNFLFIASSALFLAAEALMLGVSAYLYLGESITIGTVFLVFYYTTLITQPLEEISKQVQDLQRATGSIGRIEELLRTRSAIRDGGETLPPSGPLEVEFDDVEFGYDSSQRVLSNISLHVKAGRVLGLTGRTGCGKSTLVKLLARLHDPDRGAIGVGRTDIRKLRLADLRRRVGFVAQDVQIFDATVRENVCLFSDAYSDDQVVAALDAVGLTERVRSLPRGLDHELGAHAGLSAGERQLLALARIFLRDPGVVVLDEVSSLLDPVSERRLQRALDRLLEARTAIVIAHRLQTLQRADEILVLEDGEIVEYGPRRELMADPDSRLAVAVRAAEAGAAQ